MKIPEAAKEAGMQYESLRVALKRPHVHEELVSLKRAWMNSETLASWVAVSELRQTATSEDVKLKAARTFIGAAGELEPDRGVQGGPAMLVQIVCAPQAQPVQVNEHGVYEAPAFGEVRP